MMGKFGRILIVNLSVWLTLMLPLFDTEITVSAQNEETAPEDFAKIILQVKSTRLIKNSFKKIRPELEENDWRTENYHKNFNLTFGSFKDDSNKVEKINIEDWTREDFVRKIEEPGKIAIIYGAQRDWKARKDWTVARLLERFGDEEFRLATDDQSVVTIPLKHFMHYAITNKDDRPLYIFDKTFATDAKRKDLLDGFSVPSIFPPKDLFQYLGPQDQVRMCWILIGPPQSGTRIHVDIQYTSAWVALISGHKQWLFFPPETPPDLLNILEGNPVAWLQQMYSKIHEPSWPSEYRPIEILQRSGETMFVPSRWWHIVLNLDLTIAVTQNFCSEVNFSDVWISTLEEKPEFAVKWLEALQKNVPSIARLAVQLASQQGEAAVASVVEKWTKTGENLMRDDSEL